MGLSENVDAEEQEREIIHAWNCLPRPRPELRVEITPDGEEAPWIVNLSRHLVLPSAADQDLAHRLWSGLSQQGTEHGALHEADVFGIALRRLDEDIRSGKKLEND